uniref:Integrase catalytic domain-containing protein n=1 Tax=Amphimedon queenslandica TaxID=400682 RepID=A0A1X7UVK0_AMPQE
MQFDSFSGKMYFVSFIDDFSHCCPVYFIRQNSEVFEKFKEFNVLTTNQTGLRIGIFRTDNGREYLSNEFEKYLKSKLIHHELTVPYTPEQNGVAKQRNRMLMESARSMRAHAGESSKYWAEADRKPDVSHFRVFACLAYSHVPDVYRQKLNKKAHKFIFVGYST